MSKILPHAHLTRATKRTVGAAHVSVLRTTLLTAVIVFAADRASAQDSHYWSQKFGPVNTLVSGADDATASDNSSVINNPAGMGFNQRSNLSITTNAYQISNVKLKDGAGPGLDLRTTNLNVIPLILSGTFRHPKFPKWSAGYVLADKERYRFSASQRYDGFVNVIDDRYSSGAEEYVGQLDIKSALNETWAGFAVAYQVNDHFSVGISNLGAYREHNNSFSSIARAITDPTAAQNTVSSNFLYDVSYYSIRSMIKLGIAYKGKSMDAGLTITTPSINVFSRAVVNSDLSGVNVMLDERTGLRGSYLANDRQARLRANYRSPLSIGGGMNFRLSTATKICFAAELFTGLKPYRIIEPARASFIRPGGISGVGSQELLSVGGAAKPVLNLAVGMETQLWKEYYLLCGLRSNRSYYRDPTDEKGNAITISDLNIYHASAGVVARRGKSDICVGITGSYGRSRMMQIANLSAPDDNLSLQGATQEVPYRFYSLSGVLGYIHYLR